MPLVFAAIAPHGGLAIAEACTEDELLIAQATRDGMQELSRAFARSRPDVVIVATPHNVHISGAFAVVVAGRVAGSLDGTTRLVALDAPSDTALAWRLLETLVADGLPAVGVSFGSNDPVTAVAPMDWGVLIPLWFMGGRQDPPLPVVVIAPARDLSAAAHVRAGAAVAAAAIASGRRGGGIARAAHGHAHRADGPYGFHANARVYDDLVCELVGQDRLAGLLEIPIALVEEAKADSWWQLLMLLGATGEGWRGRLISYEAPTYFGMLTAVYLPSKVNPRSASRPRARTRRRTRAS